MPNYYTPLPAAQMPRNALLDFSGLNSGLDSIRDQKNENRNALLQQQQMDMRKDEQTYQRGRDQKQDARIDQKYFADGAQSVMNLPATDPRRAAVWQNLLKRHPNPASLTPDYLDPVKGPEMVLAEYGALADPRDSRMKDLEIGLKQAQINKLQREPAGGEAPSNVREWEVFQKMSPEDQQRYLTMKRADKYYNAGTQFVQPDPLSPGETRNSIPIDVAGKASLTAQGKAQGEALSDLPKTLEAADIALKTVQQIRQHPGKQYGIGAIGGTLPGIPGTSQRGFVNLVNQAKGQTFLQAYQMLKGGGNIANAEGAKAEAAMARLDRAQNEADFDAALNDLESVINAGMTRARARASGGPSMNAPANAAPLPDPLGIR